MKRSGNFWFIVTVNRMRVVCKHSMRLRLLLLLPLLLNSARAGFAGDTVTLKISHFGLEGNYASPAEPTWVEVTARNNTNRAVSFLLTVAELNLENDALPVTEVVRLPAEIAASETRAFDVPVYTVAQDRAVLFVQALGKDGIPLGRTGIPIGRQTEGEIIAMLCATADVCKAIRQSILLSGSAAEQTRKSSALRLIQLSKAAPTGWAYSPADTVIVATPVAQLSASQRDALEIYLYRGGKLVLVDDQLGDSSTGGSQSRFLDAYRVHFAEGKAGHVGDGQFVHLKSVSSREFPDYFGPRGISFNRPEEARGAVLQLREGVNAAGQPDQLNAWLIRRLGTTFHFPTFLELLSWIIGYLILAGIVNFLVLRRIGHAEWAWITIPTLAVLFSVLLYVVGTRNHPSNFGVDEMTVYRMDSLSPLAVTTSRVRISAPIRSVVCPVLPGDMVVGTGRRSSFPFGAPQFSFGGQSQSFREVWIGATWESSFPLRRWSFSDLEFEGQKRFAGRIFRDSVGRIHNESGLNYRQAIVADPRDVFFLGEFPASATVDLGHVPRRPYEEEAGRRTFNNVLNFPGVPFQHKPLQKEENLSEEWIKRADEELKSLPGQPFTLSELIRGWPKDGDAVFSDTKAVFFGLSDEATLGATLRDRSPHRKAATLTMVTFGEWP